jgi:hypothetical protein
VKYLAAIWLVLSVVIGYELTGMAFTRGFEQGYVEGQERALMSPQALETCTRWWFDGSEVRAKQAMNQYCERNKK